MKNVKAVLSFLPLSFQMAGAMYIGVSYFWGNAFFDIKKPECPVHLLDATAKQTGPPDAVYQQNASANPADASSVASSLGDENNKL